MRKGFAQQPCLSHAAVRAPNPLAVAAHSQLFASSTNSFLVCCYESDALFEVGHIIRPLMFPAPLDNAVLINAIVASSLPSIATLGRPVPDTLLLAQLVQVAQPGWREDVIKAGNAQAVCCICLSFCVYDDVKIGLCVLGRIRQTGEPSVGRSLVAVRDSDKLDIGICCCCVAQIEEGLLSDCSGSVGGPDTEVERLTGTAAVPEEGYDCRLAILGHTELRCRRGLLADFWR